MPPEEKTTQTNEGGDGTVENTPPPQENAGSATEPAGGEQTDTTKQSDTTTGEPKAGEAPATEDMFAGFDFSKLEFAEDDISGAKTDQGASETGEPKADVKEPPAKEPPAQEQKPTPQPAAQSDQTPAPAPQQPQQPPAAAQPDQDEQSKQLEQHREKAMAELKKFYAIDEKAAEEMGFEPSQAEALTELASRLHMAVLQNAYTAVVNRLPDLTHQTVNAVQTYRQAEDRFFSEWNVFDRSNPEHMQVLQTYGQMFRQQNPQASPEEFSKYVGAAAQAHLGLQAPAKKAPTQQRRPVPHTPAAAASGSQPAAQEPKLTHVEEMVSVFNEAQNA